MKREQSISKFFGVRIALVIATLLSLCVSNNVGPSFLPLPVITIVSTEVQQSDPENDVSRERSAPGSDSLRVPMLGQSQTRIDKDQTTQALAATLRAGLSLPNLARVITESPHQISIVSSPSILRPPGRAPPPFIV